MTKYTLKHTWIPNAIAETIIQSISSFGEKYASQDFFVVDGPEEVSRTAIKKVMKYINIYVCVCVCVYLFNILTDTVKGRQDIIVETFCCEISFYEAKFDQTKF